MKIAIVADVMSESLKNNVKVFRDNKHLVNIYSTDVENAQGVIKAEIGHKLFNKNVTFAKADKLAIAKTLDGADVVLVTTANPAQKLAQRLAKKNSIPCAVISHNNANAFELHFYSKCDDCLVDETDAKSMERVFRDLATKNKLARQTHAQNVRKVRLQKDIKARKKQKMHRKNK